MEGLENNLKASCRESYFRFVDVDEIEVRLHHFSKVKIHRNNFEYDFLLKICKLILECAVLNENTGKYEFIDFVRNEKAMAYLFEDFVRNFYNKEQDDFKVKREDKILAVVEGLTLSSRETESFKKFMWQGLREGNF